MNSSKLLEMLSKYQMVYIKPDIGTYGTGVMRVEMEKMDNRVYYVCRQGTQKHVFKSYGDLYYYVHKKPRTGNISYKEEFSC
nr:YheC/YheD family protein [Paenibacillus senegalensis]